MIEFAPKSGRDFRMNFAGDTLNTAIYFMRSLDKSASVIVDYITALSNDPFSQDMLQQWLREGIGVSLVRQIPTKLSCRGCI